MGLSVLTDIDEAARGALAELLGLVRQGDLDDAGDVPGRRLHADGVRGDELAPDEHRAEHDLQPVEEVLADDDDGGSAAGPALGRADGLDAGRGHGQRRVQACQHTGGF